MDIVAITEECPEIFTGTMDDLLRRYQASSSESLEGMAGNAQQIFCVQFLLFARKAVLLSGDLKVQETTSNMLVSAICAANPTRRKEEK